MGLTGRPRLLPLAAALLVATAAILPASAAAADAAASPQTLSDAVLHKVLYVEPNAYLQALGNISDAEDALSRTFLSPAHRRAAGKLRRWMAAAGLRTWADQVANVHGAVGSADPGRPEVWTGSHYDTVHDGGKFDGALGIVAGIAAVKAVLLEAAVAKGLISPLDLEAAVEQAAAGQRSLDLGTLLPDRTQAAALLTAPVRVVAFSDEEGVRFQSTFLGSRAATGALLDTGALGNRDAHGVSVLEALEAAGFDPSPDSIRKMAVHRDKIKAYVEVHMEQGPVLEAAGQRLGLVTAIAGQSRLQAELVGEQGHAGTVPMKSRKDPLAAAAELIAQLEQMCNGGGRGQPSNHALADDESLVCTVGSVSIWPNAGNVIPGHTNFTIDIRSRWDDNRKQVVRDLQQAMEGVCARRGLTCRLHTKNEAAAVQSSPAVVAALGHAAAEAEPLTAALLAAHQRSAQGGSGGEGPGRTCSWEAGAEQSGAAAAAGCGGRPPELVSGAGHDAMVFADVADMGMLFVRCKGGISHSPQESVAPDDVAAAAATLYRYLRRQLLPESEQ